MTDLLDETLNTISDEFAGQISETSRFYVEVDIGEKAETLGFSDIGKRYRKVLAVVPLKRAQPGMKVRIDGRTFVNYGQLASGVAVPGHVADKSGLKFKTFVPNDSMILNFV